MVYFTDYAEEKEIDVEDIKSALANLSQTMTTKHAKREKEVAQVVISKEDVELIVKEMEISKTLAEKSLRENRGSVVEALTALVNS